MAVVCSSIYPGLLSIYQYNSPSISLHYIFSFIHRTIHLFYMLHTQNTIQVTVAGVMATWCFDKSHADNCCSWAIIGSLVRSLTFSFGSICLASLVQGFVFLFRSIVDSAKQQRQQQEYQMDGGAAACCCGGLCLCIFQCLAKILEPIVECLNQLALVYCGIYGYGYLESGRRVMELMRARGWTVVLNDQLSIFVLQLMTLVVAIITGFAGVLVERFVSLYYGQYNDGSEQELPSSYIFGPLPQPALWSFGLAFFIGLWVGSIMASVLRGAVNTMIVCWADAPSAFEMEHPHLTQELATGWNAVFPSANVRPSVYGTPNLT
jgi:Plasma-membrane choline transporter